MEEKPDLERVLQYYGADTSHLRPTGWSSRKINCVIHDDSDPSMSVNLEDNKVNCHSCAFHGDSVDIIQNKEGGSVTDALRFAQDKLGFSRSSVRQAASEPASVDDIWKELGY